MNVKILGFYGVSEILPTTDEVRDRPLDKCMMRGKQQQQQQQNHGRQVASQPKLKNVSERE